MDDDMINIRNYFRNTDGEYQTDYGTEKFMWKHVFRQKKQVTKKLLFQLFWLWDPDFHETSENPNCKIKKKAIFVFKKSCSLYFFVKNFQFKVISFVISKNLNSKFIGKIKILKLSSWALINLNFVFNFHGEREVGREFFFFHFFVKLKICS